MVLKYIFLKLTIYINKYIPQYRYKYILGEKFEQEDGIHRKILEHSSSGLSRDFYLTNGNHVRMWPFHIFWRPYPCVGIRSPVIIDCSTMAQSYNNIFSMRILPSNALRNIKVNKMEVCHEKKQRKDACWSWPEGHESCRKNHTSIYPSQSVYRKYRDEYKDVGV